MLERILFALTFTAAIGSGLVAGIFFAFSTFVMAALGRILPEQGIAAMQSINITVLNPAFFIAFLGTGAVCLALAAGSYVWWGEASGKLVLAASLIYLVGCIGVTMVCNVPLNDALAAVSAEYAGGRDPVVALSQHLDGLESPADGGAAALRDPVHGGSAVGNGRPIR